MGQSLWNAAVFLNRTLGVALVETASGVRTATPSVGAFYRPRRLTI